MYTALCMCLREMEWVCCLQFVMETLFPLFPIPLSPLVFLFPSSSAFKQPSSIPWVFKASALIRGKVLGRGPVNEFNKPVVLCLWSLGAHKCSVWKFGGLCSGTVKGFMYFDAWYWIVANPIMRDYSNKNNKLTLWKILNFSKFKFLWH